MRGLAILTRVRSFYAQIRKKLADVREIREHNNILFLRRNQLVRVLAKQVRSHSMGQKPSV